MAKSFWMLSSHFWTTAPDVETAREAQGLRLFVQVGSRRGTKRVNRKKLSGNMSDIYVHIYNYTYVYSKPTVFFFEKTTEIHSTKLAIMTHNSTLEHLIGRFSWDPGSPGIGSYAQCGRGALGGRVLPFCQLRVREFSNDLNGEVGHVNYYHSNEIGECVGI